MFPVITKHAWSRLLRVLFSTLLLTSLSYSSLTSDGFGSIYDIAMENTPDVPKYLPLGTWGATGMVLTVQENSVSIDLPCANANFAGRPKLNKKHEFEALGTYNPEGPDAIAFEPDQPQPRLRKDPRPSSNARFHGKVTGKKLELTITLLETSEKLGPYSLVYGKSGRMFKCM